jgi:hypothetical protein
MWMKLVRFPGISAIGVYDRHALVSNMYGSRDFPHDFASSRAGARQAALVAKSVLESEQKKPKQCRIDTSCVESTFFPDWNLLTGGQIPHESEIQSVIILPRTKGLVRHNAHVYVQGALVGFVTSANTVGDKRSIAIVNKRVDITCLADKVVEFQNPASDHRYEANLTKCNFRSTDSVMLGM